MVTILLAMSLIFSLAACGQTPEEKLKSYVESEEFQTELETMTSSFSSVGEMEVKAEGEKLIYDLTLTTEIPDSALDAVKTQLESSFESLASTFENVANQLKNDLGIENATVVVNINLSDGTNILTFDYTATE